MHNGGLKFTGGFSRFRSLNLIPPNITSMLTFVSGNVVAAKYILLLVEKWYSVLNTSLYTRCCSIIRQMIMSYDSFSFSFTISIFLKCMFLFPL